MMECERKCECFEIEKTLLKNLGRVVTIYTENCCKGFTGLVAMVKDDTVKLITSIPSAPFERNRERRNDCDCDFNLCDHCFSSHFGSAILIPICKILAVAVVEI